MRTRPPPRAPSPRAPTAPCARSGRDGAADPTDPDAPPARARSDPKFPAHGAGREVTRVVSTGTAQIEVNIVTKDMRNFGYVEDDAGYNYTQ